MGVQGNDQLLWSRLDRFLKRLARDGLALDEWYSSSVVRLRARDADDNDEDDGTQVQLPGR